MYFSLFPPFPTEPYVFVAMSFHQRFDERWQNVIVPGIEGVFDCGQRLKAIRVDASKIGDAILTEILTHIRRCKAILGDITSLGLLDGRAVRNENVLYELGICHATRLPAEVVLFRSDKDPLPFDTQGIRVNSYDPDHDPVGARDAVTSALNDSIKEIDLSRHLLVERESNRLDPQDLRVFRESQAGKIEFPSIKTIGDFFGQTGKVTSIRRLVDAGLITISLDSGKTLSADDPIEKGYKYIPTPLGEAVFFAYLRRSLEGNPDLLKSVFAGIHTNSQSR